MKRKIALIGAACIALGLSYAIYDPADTLAPTHDLVGRSSGERSHVLPPSNEELTTYSDEPCAKCNGALHSGPVDIIAASYAAQSAVEEIMALDDILVLAPGSALQYDGSGLAGDFRGGSFRSVVFVDHDGFIGSVWFLDTPITNAVPEPSAWLMMLTGFGFIGVMLRSKRLRERRHEV